MFRRLVLTAALIVSALLARPAAAADDAEAKALELLKKYPNIIKRDEKQSGQPIIKVALRLKHENGMGMGELAPALAKLKHLHALTIQQCTITEQDAKELIQLRQLKVLHF